MDSRVKNYIKYTLHELETFVKSNESCVERINSDVHLALNPHVMSNFKETLKNHLNQTKIGYYDVQYDGMILDIKKIKVFGKLGGLRFDDPKIHTRINADLYVFRPREGAILSGVVKHKSQRYIGVVIYRVFLATIRLSQALDDNNLNINNEVRFRVIKFDLQGTFPYIDGELLCPTSGPKQSELRDRMERISSDTTADSGIELKELTALNGELFVKQELNSEEKSPKARKASKEKKSKKSIAIQAENENDLNNSTTEKKKSKDTKRKKEKKVNGIIDSAINIDK